MQSIAQFLLERIRPNAISRYFILLLIRALLKKRKFSEADFLIEAARKIYSDSLPILLCFGRSTELKGDLQLAVSRWEEISSKFPGAVDPLVHLAVCARQTWQIHKATAAIEAVLLRVPNNINILSEAARIAESRNDAIKALDYWEAVLDKTPYSRVATQGYISNLIMTGRFDEADRLISNAWVKFSNDPGVLGTEGLLHMAKENWGDACAYWRKHILKFPNDTAARELLGRSTMSLQMLKEQAQSSSVLAPVEIDAVDDEPARRMMLKFESLGSDCEFGMVQRRFGAEPLGLLRWNFVKIDRLIDALNQKFDQMGDPDMTHLTLSLSNEYYVTDRRWHFGMHTFIFQSQANYDDLIKKMCRRVVFLRERIISDLEEAQKIFVFKSENISFDDVRALYSSIRRYGPARFLFVVPVDEPWANPMRKMAPGTVECLDEGFYVGLISHAGNRGGYWDIAFDDWLSVCRRVCEMSDNTVNANS